MGVRTLHEGFAQKPIYYIYDVCTPQSMKALPLCRESSPNSIKVMLAQLAGGCKLTMSE